MAYLYILYSECLDRYYVGSTNDIERRFQEHERGKMVATKGGRPWRRVFVYQTETYVQARQLETKVKEWKRRDIIETIVRSQRLLVAGG